MTKNAFKRISLIFLVLLIVSIPLGLFLFVLLAWLLYVVVFAVKNIDFSTNSWKWDMPEPKTITSYTDYLWIHGTDEAENFFKAFRNDFDENEEYHYSAKQLKEDYEDEKVYKYGPFELPYKIENETEIYSYINENEWIYIGKIKVNDLSQLEKSTKTRLYLFPNIYKYVTEESIEKETEDPYFGLEVTIKQ